MQVLRTPRSVSPFLLHGNAVEGRGKCEEEAIELAERGNTFVRKMKEKQCKIIHMH